MSKHHCHWKGCKREVEPKKWGCHTHWYTLPKRLRDKIWATYVPGQEITKTPSHAYMLVIREVDQWIEEYVKNQRLQLELKGMSEKEMRDVEEEL